MIQFGSSLCIAVICPDCSKPMSRHFGMGACSLNVEGDFICVSCVTENCVNRYFVSTVEKKTGMVVYTNANYKWVEGSYEPIYTKYEEAER